MITSKFYSQTYVCPRCQGLGLLELQGSRPQSCEECGGGGVFLAQADYIYYWKIPSFIDYKTRRKVTIAKIVGGVLILTIFIAIIMLVINLSRAFL